MHELLADADVPAAIRSWAAGDPGRAWTSCARLAKIGVAGLAVPERFDGMGAGSVELVVVFEQLGRHAVPGPMVESFAAVPALLADISGAERWLPGLATGELLATVAMPPHVPYALDADVAVPFLVDGRTPCTPRSRTP